MAKEAEAWVDSCAVCAMNGKPEKTTPMKRVLAPKSVWETIAVDFNGPYMKYGGVSILVIVDYRSRYIIAKPVKSTSFENTRRVLDAVFEKEGFPQSIKSDNGPPFNGDEYKQYCIERGINVIFSTPLHPQQNGLAESCMKLVNKAMTAAASSGTNYTEELNSAVQAYNAGAHSIIKLPPEEVLMGRRIRRGLPLLRRGKVEIDDELLDTRDKESKLNSKDREDQRRGARLCRIKPGDTVLVERQSRAKAEPRFDPRRYTVREEQNGMLVLIDENGQILKRHVSQTKRVVAWRHPNDAADSKTGVDETARRHSTIRKDDEVPASGRRSMREKRAPGYLKNYVHVTENADLRK